MSKNEARLDPLATPRAYGDHFDGKKMSLEIACKDGSKETFEFYKRIDDPRTSFSASVMINKATGHAVVFYKGTDLPGRDEGAGAKGFIGDIASIRQAQAGHVSDQMLVAEQAYLEISNDPAVKSLEIVGYSIGSEYLNYVAAKYDAKGTAIADMGLSDQVLQSIRVQNKSEGRSSYENNLQDNIAVLNLDADILPKTFAAGPSRGRVIDLDGDFGGHFAATGIHAVKYQGHIASSLLNLGQLEIKGSLREIFAAFSEGVESYKNAGRAISDLTGDFNRAVFEPLAMLHIPQIYAKHAEKLGRPAVMQDLSHQQVALQSLPQRP